MILFFKASGGKVIAVKHQGLSPENIAALKWLFSNSSLTSKERVKVLDKKTVHGNFIGPRREMITPWSTTAVEITQNMNISGIERIEEFFPIEYNEEQLKKALHDGIEVYDPMLQRFYNKLDKNIFTIEGEAQPIVYITDLESYNKQEGLALSKEEIRYLKALSKRIGRELTDSEVFGFSQVNSEHCRHKIFNGTITIDKKECNETLFDLIKKTSELNPNLIVSAYKDNCAFLKGPKVEMFHPASGNKPDFFKLIKRETVISLKAETHNFPTTVEPFNGAATGTGGEIRDRMAGGKGSFPLAGTAVYMTSYTRLGNAEERPWNAAPPRKWLYQSPENILTKASNGASDFGNKFGQPIICGSLLTFEHVAPVGETEEHNPNFGYDKAVMLAGGVGFAKKADAKKSALSKGDQIILLGGDNYRIGMGGGSVSSVNTGKYGNAIELNAIQRANAEMQKRAYNAIRSLAEKDENPIVSIHDHGAGGHLNCLSELLEQTGGKIDISKLPVGDPTLSLKEIIGNESQERMGLALHKEDVQELQEIAQRERAPFYQIGEATGDNRFTLIDEKSGQAAIDLKVKDLFGNTPKSRIKDKTVEYHFNLLTYNASKFETYLAQVLRLESVACKDWLTNKVDRSVTGLIANQQCAGPLQLPINDVAVTAIGYNSKAGIATSIGHAPVAGLIDPAAGSRLSIAEALTNLVFAPVKGGLKSVSLSANWMWPARNPGEDARLYKAVKAASDFACQLGINIPTGKDSMSMTQNYPGHKKVLAPGTVIISTAAPVKNIKNVITADLKPSKNSSIIYIPFSTSPLELGGSAFAQSLGQVGTQAPDIDDAQYFAKCFEEVQKLINMKAVLAGHDISAGGLITSLLEMCFASNTGGVEFHYLNLPFINLMFSEMPGVLLQIRDSKIMYLKELSVKHYVIGRYIHSREIVIPDRCTLYIDDLRDIWYETSYLMDKRQTANNCAEARYKHYKKQPLSYRFPKRFSGRLPEHIHKIDRESAPVAAIIREKGSNGDREMAWALYIAGFRVKDVHMTDLISGREDLTDVQMVVFVGGFSNADTLGSAKGWAGAFLYNDKANKALKDFYARKDTLSLGICNGCQLMIELDLISQISGKDKRRVTISRNTSQKFESNFVGVNYFNPTSILLRPLRNCRLGVWVAHGEGRINYSSSHASGVRTALKYAYSGYPGNPNGSSRDIAGICSPDGRHLAMMPHPERCIRPWNWPYYSQKYAKKEVSPWMLMFIAGYQWCKEHQHNNHNQINSDKNDSNQ